MRIFAISDLHLSFTSNKPMDRFGEHWYRHHEKIEANWRQAVREEDVVLIPGDHSWAMKLHEALPDLQWIARLPGTKIMGKGNHDLWWTTMKRLTDLDLPSTCWLHNSAFIFGNVGICGTRGWSFPRQETEPPLAPEELQEEKVYRHELERLKISFTALEEARRQHPGNLDAVICMLHFPPLLSDRLDTDVTRLLVENGVTHCVYGHMHLSHQRRVFRGVRDNIKYDVCSCDFNEFAPLLVYEQPA